MGGKPSRLLGAKGQTALHQGGKKPLAADATFFADASVGAAVSLGVASVDPSLHPGVARRLRVPVADEPGAADALAARFDEACAFLHARTRRGCVWGRRRG